jgi:hypothetical protein
MDLGVSQQNKQEVPIEKRRYRATLTGIQAMPAIHRFWHIHIQYMNGNNDQSKGKKWN